MYIRQTYWTFLIASAVLYWLAPRNLRTALLALLSIGYIAAQDFSATLVALASVAVVLISFSRVQSNTRRGEIVALVLAGGLIIDLAYHKVFRLAAPGAGVIPSRVVIPLGLSFFTFKMIDFISRTQKGEIPRLPLDKALLYFFMFPVYPAGPMARADEFYRDRDDRFTREAWVEGLTRIVQGLVKKFALADALVMAFLHRGPDGSTMAARMIAEPTVWAWADVFMLQIFVYLDFSAYSDLAIGGARLFGYRIPENFRYPLFAVNIGEFWKRWHITLSQLCRLYIYRPMLARTRSVQLSMAVTMIVIALWHGATSGWLLWGAYHATGLSIYAYYRQKVGPPPEKAHPVGGLAAWAGTMTYVSSACVFLVAGPSDWRSTARILKNLVGF